MLVPDCNQPDCDSKSACSTKDFFPIRQGKATPCVKPTARRPLLRNPKINKSIEFDLNFSLSLGWQPWRNRRRFSNRVGRAISIGKNEVFSEKYRDVTTVIDFSSRRPLLEISRSGQGRDEGPSHSQGRVFRAVKEIAELRVTSRCIRCVFAGGKWPLDVTGAELFWMLGFIR